MVERGDDGGPVGADVGVGGSVGGGNGAGVVHASDEGFVGGAERAQ